MVSQILAQIAALSAYQKSLLVIALFKNRANRDVLAMLLTGRKTTQGTGVFQTGGLVASVISNIRDRILIADLPALRNALFKNRANRDAFASLSKWQQNRFNPAQS